MKSLLALASLVTVSLPCSAAINPVAVPEPSTYGIIAVVALVGVVAARRFTRRQK